MNLLVQGTHEGIWTPYERLDRKNPPPTVGFPIYYVP